MQTKNLTIRRGNSTLEIVYTWRTPAAYFLIFFSVVWNLALLFLLAMGAGWAVSLHLVIGIALVYYTLALMVNKTHLTVDSRQLRITHGPLPLLQRNRELPARAIRQLFLARGGAVRRGRKRTILWSLRAELDTGAEITLLRGIRDREVGERLERAVEDFLSIRDDPRPVEATLDLPDFSRLKEKLPASLRGRVAAAEEHLRESMLNELGAAGGDGGDRVPLGGSTRVPRPLPPPHDNYNYQFYRATPGDQFLIDDAPYRLGRHAQFDWADPHQPLSRQLDAEPRETGGLRHFYAELVRDRWLYFEERRLDGGEVASLGFTAAAAEPPRSFTNGDEKYYPRDHQSGHRFTDGRSDEVEQFVYFTTRSATQFRAVRVPGEAWEVYVQEPIDSAVFQE